MSLLVNYFYKAVTPEMLEQVYYKDHWNTWIKVIRPLPSPKEDPSFCCIKIESTPHEFNCDYQYDIRKADIDNSMKPCSEEEWIEVIQEGVAKIKSIV